MTFATLFASGMLGLSLLGWFRHWMTQWGAPWYLLFLLPMLLVAVVARKEEEWLPDPELRKQCARWLILGSILIVMLVTWWSPRPVAQPKAMPVEPQGRARVQGR